MDPPATEPAAAPVSEALSNNNTSENVAEVPEGNASSSAPAAAAEPTAMEVDAPVVETNNSSVPGTKYPKVSLRLNEFGIYELATEEEPSPASAASVVAADGSTAPPVVSTDVTQLVAVPVKVESSTESAAAATAAIPSASQGQGTETNNATKAAVEPSTTPSTNTTTNNTSSNGERERWKQRFPSTTKVQVDIVCCKQCDGYGIADEFVDAHYCSEKCRKLGTARQAHLKGSGAAGKVGLKRKSTSSNSSASVVEGSNIVESSIESADRCIDLKDTYDAKGKGSSWSWSKYLERRRAQAAPERLFTDPFPYRKHGFRYGMKLEGIDPEHQSLFCVMTVAEVQGYRLRLHFDGYSDSHDVWLNADSENLFPVGWCEKNGQKLRPPKNYVMPNSSTGNLDSTHTSQSPSQQPTTNPPLRTFTWPQYLKFTGSAAAPRHLFVSTQNDSPLPSAFRVRMKLEAVDRRHSSHTLCVATVANVIGSRFLVHFDGWDSVYDYWADPTCPYVHPVGWAQEHNTTLTPPCDYDASEGEFSWDQYLARTASTAVPPRAFKPRSPVGFKTGMKLECVDPRNPQLIRVATVAAVKGYRLKIHFDGWSSDFDFWTDDDWPDLHPPGWCQKTGHPLQPPLTTESTASSGKGDSGGRCPTPGCTGVGHIEGARYPTHSSLDDCPYSARNLHRESPAFPDRLLGEDIGVGPEASVSGGAASPFGSTATDAPVKEEVQRKVKAVKNDAVVDSSISLSPVHSQLAKGQDGGKQSGSDTPSTKASKAANNSQQQSIDLPIKSESEAELNNRLIQVDLRAESPSLDQQYDSLEALTPPPKKMKLSYFTGKTAAKNDVERRKSVQEPASKENGTDHHSERQRRDDSGRFVKDQPSRRDSAGDSTQPLKPSAMQDFHANASLITPFYWSKHASLLGSIVDGATSSEAAKWTYDQVCDFLVKFGLSSLLLDRFKEEQIDGEALLYLTQSDLTDLLGVKLGPAIKIRNALLLMMETAKPSPASQHLNAPPSNTTSPAATAVTGSS